jgi:hypothetical protein
MIVAPKKVISSNTYFLSEKLRNGKTDDQLRAMKVILQGLNNNKTATMYLDTTLTDALFSVIEEDISKFQGPTKKQIKYRKKIDQGKTLSEEKVKIAYELSPRELAERNKAYAIYLVAMIQNTLCDQLKEKADITPKFSELPIVQRLVKESQTNSDDNIKGASLSALLLLNRPEFEGDITRIYNEAMKSNNKKVKEYATKSLKNLEEERAYNLYN